VVAGMRCQPRRTDQARPRVSRRCIPASRRFIPEFAAALSVGGWAATSTAIRPVGGGIDRGTGSQSQALAICGACATWVRGQWQAGSAGG
jgi:hypothetical protein